MKLRCRLGLHKWGPATDQPAVTLKVRLYRMVRYCEHCKVGDYSEWRVDRRKVDRPK